MSDKEVDESKAKRGPDSSDGNEDDEKRATRKKARVDYSEDKSKATQPSNEKEEADEEEEEDDDEIQDVTPANIKSKSEETVNEPRPTRSTSDDLMGLPMEPTGLEGAGNLQFSIFCSIISNGPLSKFRAECIEQNRMSRLVHKVVISRNNPPLESRF